jgi:hypothetical protein
MTGGADHLSIVFQSHPTVVDTGRNDDQGGVALARNDRLHFPVGWTGGSVVSQSELGRPVTDEKPVPQLFMLMEGPHGPARHIANQINLAKLCEMLIRASQNLNQIPSIIDVSCEGYDFDIFDHALPF